MIRQTTIRAKLMLLVGGFFLAVLLTGVVGMGGIEETSEHYEADTTAMMRIANLLDSLYHRRGSILLGIAAESAGAAEAPFKEAERAGEETQKDWAEHFATLNGDEKLPAEKFDVAWKDYLQASKQTIELARGGDYERAVENMKGDAAQKFAAARRSLLDLADDKKKHFAHTKQSNALAKTALLGFLLAALLLGGFASWRIIRSITRPLGQIQTTIGGVEANADFTQRVTIDSTDEIGRMAQSFNSLMTTLQSALREILDNVEKVSATAHDLTTTASQAAVSSASQSEAATTMANTVEQITTSIRHVSENARDALAISRTAGDLSEHGGATIQSASAEMMAIADAVRQTSAIIQDLGAKSNEISTVVQVIKDVAAQTNLLALNAAIEAARAGEQGRGFAVVADAVRKLAERTTQATVEIARMIDAIQHSAHAAVEGMNAAVSKVDGGVALAEQAAEAIREIRDGAARVVTVVDEISSALGTESVASNDIARNVEQIALTSRASHTVADAAALAARRLEQLSAAARGAVERFRI